PERAAMAQAGKHLDRVLLDLLPRAAPVSLLAPMQIRVDRPLLEDETCRQSAHDRDERRTVRLTCRRELERHAVKRSGPFGPERSGRQANLDEPPPSIGVQCDDRRALTRPRSENCP